MRLSPIFLTLAAAALAPAAAHAEDAKPAAERTGNAYIAFANHGGVRDWRADDKDTVYFQDRQRHWYKAELMSPAFDLPYTLFIGIDAEPGDRLDRFSSVYVKGQRYVFRSFERIEGAPPKKKKRDKDAE